ncbi:ROK family protein [Caldilinea sp.]|uniref:ROK family protein n=1 Tax=Caldilinea sp. TaxID=2293560 RepID=UPI002C0BB447|nr:ROK family protein [Caldilinea sp.]HRA64974.1 ROK family protein [Caldilinea sp.]
MITLGIDGGGTKTRCVAVSEDGEVLATTTVGSTNVNAIEHGTVRERLAEAIVTVLSQASAEPDEVVAVGLGMSGVGRPADAQLVRRWMAEILPHAYAYVDNDAVAALASGTGGDLYGVVIISGTGMIVLGVDGAGQRRRAGGWGAILGDPGGGFSIGAAALQSITAAADSSGPVTTLTARVLTELHLREVQDLVAWTYGQPGWAHVAGLARLVEECARENDEVAFRILAWAADNLAQRAEAVIRGLALENQSFPLVLAGGNLTDNALLRRLLTSRLEEVAPHAEIVTPHLDAAVGAALLALKQAWKREQESR